MIICCALLLGGASMAPNAGREAAADIRWLGRFGAGIAGWSTQSIDRRVPPTVYRLRRIEGVDAIEAVAQASMALFVRTTDVDLGRTPILCWRWRIEAVVENADIRRRSGDDQAARIYVGLDLPDSAMSLATRAQLAIGRTRYGGLLPDGALNYVWDNRTPQGTILPNAFTGRTRMIVLRSGNGAARRWVNERRDILADMRSQFGTTEGRMTLLAVASDTDNTGGRAHAAFADLHLVARNAPCRFG